MTIIKSMPWMRFFFLFVPLAFGFYALILGQDANWDLRNYHYYIPYAWLTHRLDIDVAPAHHATFYNPTLYIPFYLAVNALPPKIVAFLLGTLQGLNFIPLFFIARALLISAEGGWLEDSLSNSKRVSGYRRPGLRRQQSRANVRSSLAFERQDPLTWWSVLLALLGLCSAMNLSEIGTMFSDNLVSLLVLSSMLLMLHICASIERSTEKFFTLFSAGLLAGLAAGLKQPASLYAMALCLAVLVLPTSWPKRFYAAFIFGIGVTLGFAATGGWWMLELWRRFGNPLFPYYNTFFHSPMASAATYLDRRFISASLLDAVLRPYELIARYQLGAEVPFRDLRLAIFYSLGILAILFSLLLRHRKQSISPAVRYFLVVCAASYGLWLKQFGVTRYLVTLDMLAPIGIYLLIHSLWKSPAHARWTTLAIFAVMVVSLRPASWGRVPWGADTFGVMVPKLSDPDHSLVVMTGVEPMAYVIPFFPSSIPFLRIQGYFTGPSNTPNGYDVDMQGRIRTHVGPIYVLYRDAEVDVTNQALAAYHLSQQEKACQVLKPHIDAQIKGDLRFCLLKRI